MKWAPLGRPRTSSRTLRSSQNRTFTGIPTISSYEMGSSGTPSVLLPIEHRIEFGQCNFEEGDDGRIMHTLTSPRVVSCELMPPTWTPEGILDHIARAAPPFNALIDTGALITGFTNLQVGLGFRV